jgi:hypothetical protein
MAVQPTAVQCDHGSFGLIAARNAVCCGTSNVWPCIGKLRCGSPLDAKSCVRQMASPTLLGHCPNMASDPNFIAASRYCVAQSTTITAANCPAFSKARNSACCGSARVWPCTMFLRCGNPADPASCAGQLASLVLPGHCPNVAQDPTYLAAVQQCAAQATTQSPLPQTCNQASFGVFAARVSTQCCGRTGKSCANGMPQSCSADCATVLLPMQARCVQAPGGYARTIPQLAQSVNSAAKLCQRPGGGH